MCETYPARRVQYEQLPAAEKRQMQAAMLKLAAGTVLCMPADLLVLAVPHRLGHQSRGATLDKSLHRHASSCMRQSCHSRCF